MITLHFLTSGKVAEVEEGGSLLRLSIRAGGGIPFKCAGGVCGRCRCRIEAGREAVGPVTPQERRHLDEAALAAGWRMACQTQVAGDLDVSWPEGS